MPLLRDKVPSQDEGKKAGQEVVAYGIPPRAARQTLACVREGEGTGAGQGELPVSTKKFWSGSEW